MSFSDPNTVILFGGTSDEARVSVASAQNLARHVAGATLWFWDSANAVHEVSPAELATHENPFTTDYKPQGSLRFESLDAAIAAMETNQVVFLALHGGDGENGVLQEKLERAGVAFTGSDADSSAAAFDKNEAKRIAAKAGVNIASGAALGVGDPEPEAVVRPMLSKHGELILKPVAGGSSIGLFRLNSENAVSEVLREVRKKNVPYLVEPFLKGREFTVGIVDMGRGPEPLPPSEVRLTGGANFDFEGKYLGRNSQEITPAEISEDLTRALQAVALKSHEALSCFGYSRTDLIVTENGEVFFVELNTLPGLTKASFIPQQLAAAGLSFEAFLKAQLSLSRDRLFASGVNRWHQG